MMRSGLAGCLLVSGCGTALFEAQIYAHELLVQPGAIYPNASLTIAQHVFRSRTPGPHGDATIVGFWQAEHCGGYLRLRDFRKRTPSPPPSSSRVKREKSRTFEKK